MKSRSYYRNVGNELDTPLMLETLISKGPVSVLSKSSNISSFRN